MLTEVDRLRSEVAALQRRLACTRRLSRMINEARATTRDLQMAQVYRTALWEWYEAEECFETDPNHASALRLQNARAYLKTLAITTVGGNSDAHPR